MTAGDVREAMSLLANEEQARHLSRFFKTGKGQYGEGDIFWGIRVPQTRAVVKESHDIPLAEAVRLLHDPVHEIRLCGFLLLVEKFRRAKKDPVLQEMIVNTYLENARYANNWDLVDLSAPKILGEWLKDKDKHVLYELVASKNLWEQRIAIVTTWMLIRYDQYEDTLRLAEILMDHPHDLIRKATGWMLREVGKRDRELLLGFLDRYATHLSRVSLRYAIEHLPEDVRQEYLGRK
ncbi:MAG: DNA alkylation repair protein [Bacteroidales bacterium]